MVKFARLLLGGIATTNIATTTSFASRRAATGIAFAKSHISMTMSAADQKQALISCPTINLRDGTSHPLIGFGTYKVGFIPASSSNAAPTDGMQRTAEECVSDALDVGYRFLEWYVCVCNILLLYSVHIFIMSILVHNMFSSMLSANLSCLIIFTSS